MHLFHASNSRSHVSRALGPVLVCAGLLGLTGTAQAQAPAGDVTHLSGLLTARRDDGSTRLLATRSVVHEGESLVTGADSYMELRFLDDAVLVMGPDSQVHVTRYSWNPDRPADDSVVLEVQRGSVRSETGRLGKRRHEAIRILVPGGEIAVHGTTFVVQYVAPPTGQVTPPLAVGLYVHVIDGVISLSTGGGSQNFTAGQFGYTASVSQPPVLVPTNPGIQFTPPPSFAPPATSGTSTAPGKSGTVDCIVR
jgi:hypothetical protein